MQEEIKHAIDIAFRAEGFDEQSREQGFIRRGEIIRDTRERILGLETAEVLKRMLDKHGFDSGKRKYYPIKEA